MKNWDSFLAITWRSWSKSAIECYQRGCICYECPTQALFAEKCKMKEAVLSLVRQFGEPPKNIEGVLPDLTEGQIEVINAIVNGANTFEDIAEVIGITILGVKSRLNKVYEAAKLQGFAPENKRYMLPELTIFLRELAKQYVPPEEPPKIIYCNPEYISPINPYEEEERTELWQ